MHILIGILIGTILGLLTGFLPGIHPNNFIKLIPEDSIFFAISFLVSLSISNSFFSLFASIFLGAPESDTVLSVHPGHRLMKKGYGLKAFYIGCYTSLFASIFSLIFYPFFEIFGKIYNYTLNLLPFLLLLILIYMNFCERNKYSILITFFAGMLGFISLNLKIRNPIFPLLSGLFGGSTIIISYFTKTKLVPQKEISSLDKYYFKEIFLGIVASILLILFPSISPSIAILFFIPFLGKISDEEFIAIIGSITTADSIFSTISYFLIGNPRSGISVAIKNILGEQIYPFLNFILFIIIISSFLSFYLSIKFSKILLKIISKIDYRYLNLFIFIYLSLLSIYLSGFLGFIVFIASTLLGIYTQIKGISKSILMSSLIIPTILSFIL